MRDLFPLSNVVQALSIYQVLGELYNSVVFSDAPICAWHDWVIQILQRRESQFTLLGLFDQTISYFLNFRMKLQLQMVEHVVFVSQAWV